MNFLANKYALALTVALLLQTGAYYAAETRRESLPVLAPLDQFPASVGSWRMVQEYKMEKEIADVLKADDTLNRVYASAEQPTAASLFIAFFKTQRTGQAPHSPKNCLPGSGWEPSATGTLDIALPGGRTIGVNRYVVSRGDEKSVVLYWYNSHNRVIAKELTAKLWLVADSVRYNRSDTALVRVVVPVRAQDEKTAVDTAVSFVRAMFPEVQKQLSF
jgi:EpsI family protein